MSYTTIEEGSEATPGLWNSRFSDLWASMNSVTSPTYSAITAVRSTEGWNVQSLVSVSNLSTIHISIGTSQFPTENFLLERSGSAGTACVMNLPLGGVFTTQGSGYVQCNYDGSISMVSGVQVAGNNIIGTRKTGWTSVPTGAPLRTTFVTSSATLGDVAQRLAALIIDLTAHGLIGP